MANKQKIVKTREILQFTPMKIGYGRILKVCIMIIVIMCVLSLNLGTFETIDKGYNHVNVESDIEVQYSQNYLNSFNDNTSSVFNRLVMTGKAFEIYGSNQSWAKVLNNFSETGNTLSTLNFISTALFIPLNLIINTGILFINIVNALTGGEKLIVPNYKSPQEVINNTTANLFNWGSLPFWTTPTWNIFN